jgi:hypothetical protein
MGIPVKATTPSGFSGDGKYSVFIAECLFTRVGSIYRYLKICGCVNSNSSTETCAAAVKEDGLRKDLNFREKEGALGIRSFVRCVYKTCNSVRKVISGFVKNPIKCSHCCTKKTGLVLARADKNLHFPKPLSRGLRNNPF